ncbi:RidA family protein [Pseudomonas atacamensis]|uniref:RidA family protein n=1 Tax=Pseudomonas atacamensis TaxID=2565368 RepID=A0AAQ2HYH6_9PSED|nr:Rid family detoxifying hydrolase [Pseudomonas atacamensis]THF25779.1 RidA family protein [Pseudomonas atacamensis]
MNKNKVFSLLTVGILFTLTACTPMQVKKEVISSSKAPTAIGPYSQAIRAGNVVFLSGQLPTDPNSNQTQSNATIEEQTRLVIENLGAVLQSKGLTYTDVVSTQVFMTDLSEFTRMNAVYGSYFKDAPPARATVGVAKLPRDVKVEISAIAISR